MGFFEVYHRVASGKTHTTPGHDATQDADVQLTVQLTAFLFAVL